MGALAPHASSTVREQLLLRVASRPLRAEADAGGDAESTVAVARALLAYPDCRRFEAGLQGRKVTVHQYVE